MKMKKKAFILKLCLLVPVLLLVISNQVIRFSTAHYLYDSVELIPYNEAGLVLGTSPRVRNGGPNPYFSNRMEAAAELYHNGKVSILIVSGDNRSRYYNEPEQMRRALVALGVPSSSIILDQAGLRTLDSVIRARDVFNYNEITIISQKFHNQRAVFIAKQKGMRVYALNARDVDHSSNDRTRLREWFAKAIVFWDLLTDKQPQHLEKEISVSE